MARDFAHLDLPQVQAPLPRKRYGGGSQVVRQSPSAHAKKLKREAAQIKRLQEHRRRPTGVTPALIFKLKLDPHGDLDEDTLAKFGLTLISRDLNKTLVVFASDEDLALFEQRVATYGSPTGHKYAEVGSIEAIAPITPDDRTGRRLREEPLPTGSTPTPLDVELWHPGDRDRALARARELAAAADDLGARVSDQYIGRDLIVARCHATAAQLRDLLEIDYVREIDRIPAADVLRLQALGMGAGDLEPIQAAPEAATGILILDTGVAANHPLLHSAVGETRAFPRALGERDGLGGADGDQRSHGHGTAVAGFAVWGRPHAAATGQLKRAEVNLFSARVLDGQASYDPDELVEHQLEEALTYYLRTYPQCKVINLSLGDPHMVYYPGDRQSRLAARIDELAHELQERNVLFVLCTGNYGHQPADLRQHRDDYPAYLLEDRAGLIEPGTAALALTVGGLADGGAPARHAGAAGRDAIAAVAGHPSPFTRTGPGLAGMIKPDLVEAAGDFAYDESLERVDVNDPGLGLPTTNRDFAPPNGQLMRAVTGTSFAAPAVAHIAARVFNEYPDATPNLVRALLADSAQLPARRPPMLRRNHDDSEVLRVYGYGRADYERAIASEENDVLILAEAEIVPDSFQLFEVPFIPPDFMALKGERTLSVTLAFDPPTRQTRSDRYLGLTMIFHLFRNITMAEVAAAYRDWSAAPAGSGEQQLEQALSSIPGRQKVDLTPGVNTRRKGTLQRGRCRVATRGWDYQDGPLILAVSCLRSSWLPEDVSRQRYALVLSIKHSDPDAKIYTPLQARLRARPRARIR